MVLLGVLSLRLLRPIHRLKLQASTLAARESVPALVWRQRDELAAGPAPEHRARAHPGTIRGAGGQEQAAQQDGHVRPSHRAAATARCSASCSSTKQRPRSTSRTATAAVHRPGPLQGRQRLDGPCRRRRAAVLARTADLAMYRSKDLGKARFSFYHPDLDTALRRPPGAGTRAGARHRSQRAGAALPAGVRCRDRPRGRQRGTGALDAPAARPADAGRLHPCRRRNRPDRRARAVDIADRLRAARSLAGRRPAAGTHRRQRVGAAGA